MAATATARRVASAPARPARAPRKAPPRRQPTRRAAPARGRRSQATPIPGRLVPLAVAGTAGAVGGLADSGLVVRLTRGRLWIGALGVLLVGIVGLNVLALSFSASSSRVAQQTDGLKRANSALQARIAGQASNQELQAAATRLGLIVPEPGAIRYLTARPGDAAIAARRLREGELMVGTVVAPAVALEPVTATQVPTAAVAPAQTPEPAATVEPAAEPVVAAPAPAPAAPVATGGGGVSP